MTTNIRPSRVWTDESLSQVEVVDFLMGYYRFFSGLSLRLRTDISKVTAHERIQHLYRNTTKRFTQHQHL
jgi:hypothetical protein